MLRALFAFLIFLYSPKSPNDKTESESLLLSSSLKGYFTFPIAPGTTASLSGSFGDIRINHFHSGLDIRTGGREGKSVFAAAEGYVSRIMVSRGGYGNALYITHPNGYTTLYAHLKEYVPKIKAYLNEKQYEQEKWEIDVYLEPGEIPIKKAEMVAFSGNTGGSGGPHLHFEVRDAQENTLDPADFDFFEIRDNVAPHIEVLSVVCKSKDALVNGRFGSFDLPVKKLSNGQYSIGQILNIQGEVGFELYTYDKSQTSPFRLGIKSLRVTKNENQTYFYKLDKLSFYNKIDMNVHTNYDRMLNDSKKFHKAYYEPGNSLGLYEIDQNNGIMSFSQGITNKVHFDLKDTFGNSSELSLNVVNKPSKKENPVVSRPSIKVEGRFMELLATPNSLIEVETGVEKKEFNYTEPVVFDIKNDLIKGIKLNGVKEDLPFNAFVEPDNAELNQLGYKINLNETLYFGSPILVQNGTKLQIHEDVIPLKGRFDVDWKTDVPKDLIHASVYLDGKNPKFIGGEWYSEGIKFQPKEFGTYLIMSDNEEPTIRPRLVNSQNLQFTIADKLSGIKSIECFVNNEWVKMEYEYKNGLIWSEKLDSSKPFEGDIDLYVTDNANNKAHYSSKI